MTHLVTNRHVLTYQPNGRPLGVITGYEHAARTFVVEHVVVFPGGNLLALLRHGLEEAWARYDVLILSLSARYSLPGWTPLVQRLGFTAYDCEGDITWYAAARR